MKAVLVKDVAFKWGDETTFIPEGTVIVVDLATSTGFYEDEHFEIFPDEYVTVH